jgi:PncC family amidohydrolase
VSYSNQVKHQLLQVRESTLTQFGAVSRETCVEMLDGLAHQIPSEIGIAVTGIAGPGGGSPQKPVGTIWVGIRLHQRYHYTRLSLVGSRQEIRQATADFALDTLFKMIEGEI